MENNKIKCRFCGSKNFIKKGFRKTQNRGKIQKFRCNDCSKFFVNDEGFIKMKNTPQKITLCMDLFFRGVSLRKVQEHLQAFYPHNSSHMTILRWVRKYSVMISKYTNNLKLKVGVELQVDEMEYKTKGKKSWFIDSIDTETRFMVSSNFCQKREQVELRKVMVEAKEKTGEQIKIVTTDGYLAYPKAVKLSFGYNLKLNQHNVYHKIVNASRGEGFNHKVERMHNNIRARTKTFRGFGSIESANAIMKGYEVYYNFIMKHQALNKCPYELATDLKLNENNKWLELIGLSC